MSENDYIKNRNAFPPEELEKYYGKFVAWSLDGTRIVASGDDDLQVFEALKAAGQDTSQVVFSYVERPDEVIMGGAMPFNEELED
jgi:hypothetical protein